MPTVIAPARSLDWSPVEAAATVPRWPADAARTAPGPGLRIVTPEFRAMRGDKAGILGFFAGRARGAMARFVIVHRLDEPEAITDFTEDGYRFEPARSNADTWVFSRPATTPG